MASHMPTTARAERHRRVAAAYAEGRPPRVLAPLYGLSARRIRYVANLYGVSRPRGRPANSNSKGERDAKPNKPPLHFHAS